MTRSLLPREILWCHISKTKRAINLTVCIRNAVMDIMTHAKYYFNRPMLTLIFAIWASEPPRAWRTTEKAGPDRVNSVAFIKKPLVNQVYIRICSFWLTFTVLQWMKKSSKNSQFSNFLLRSMYANLVKIWKWLKLFNSVPFIKKRLLNHVYIRIWSSWLTFTVSQGMKANIKISQFSRFLLRSEFPIQVKIWKWLKLLNSVAFIKKPLVNQVYIRIWSFWLTFTVLQWMKKTPKIVNFQIFC